MCHSWLLARPFLTLSAYCRSFFRLPAFYFIHLSPSRCLKPASIAQNHFPQKVSGVFLWHCMAVRWAATGTMQSLSCSAGCWFSKRKWKEIYIFVYRNWDNRTFPHWRTCIFLDGFLKYQNVLCEWKTKRKRQKQEMWSYKINRWYWLYNFIMLYSGRGAQHLSYFNDKITSILPHFSNYNNRCIEYCHK